jgi:RNA polymerase sigma-70 factor (ECF subfamily)
LSSDRQLARRIQQGDVRAFEELLDLYGARVQRLARRFLDNPSDVDDVTQEIFIDIHRCIGAYRGDSALMTWIYRIAANHCLRHRERTRPESLPYEDRTAGAATDWRAYPEQSVARRELSDQVYRALGRLPELHRDVVVLHELHGLTYQECAAALGVPVGTVKSRLSNAFRRLRTSLGGYVLGEAAGCAAGEVIR